MNFEELKLGKQILKSIIELGYKNPTPIQDQIIPKILVGQDVLGIAPTGTGKTAAFSLYIQFMRFIDLRAGQIIKNLLCKSFISDHGVRRCGKEQLICICVYIYGRLQK